MGELWRGSCRDLMVAKIVRHMLAMLTLMFSASPVAAAAPNATTVDPHIVFTAPAADQVFAPGDTVLITVETLPPLREKVTDALLGASGLGMLAAPQFDQVHKSFTWSMTIPLSFTGPLTFNPMIVTGVDPLHPDQAMVAVGAPRTVKVQTKDAPSQLTLTNSLFFVVWPGCCGPPAEYLYVKGTFGTIERDLTSAAAGTTYTSSDPTVAAVDTEGAVQLLKPGLATVIAENHGYQVMAGFLVEDPIHPLPPQDFTTAVHFTTTALELDPTARAYHQFPLRRQLVTVTNSSTMPLMGPFYLKVRGLPEAVQLWGKIANAPLNPPPNMTIYYWVHPGSDATAILRLTPTNGLSLAPGESLQLPLYFFTTPPDLSIPGYDLALVRSSVTPK